MARPRKGNRDAISALTGAAMAIANAEGEADETEQETEQEQAASEIMSDVMGDGGVSPIARIYRQDGDTGMESFVDKVSATMISEEWLAKQYGGGEYRVQFRGPTKGGKVGYTGQKRFSIDAKIPRRTPRYQEPAVNPPNESGGGLTPDGDMAMLLKSQIVDMVRSSSEQRRNDAQMQAATLQMMMGMMQQSSQMMQGMIATMVTAKGESTDLLTKLLPILAPKAGGDPLEMLIKLKALDGPKNNLSEMLEAIRQLKETSEMFGPQGSDDDGMMGMVKSLAPSVMGLLANANERANANARPPMRPMARPSPVGALAAPMPHETGELPATEEPEIVNPWKQITPFVPMILEKAATDEDAGDYAYSVVGFVPLMMRGTLRELANRPEAVQELTANFPAFAQYPTWTEAFIAGIREAINPQAPMGDEEGAE